MRLVLFLDSIHDFVDFLIKKFCVRIQAYREKRKYIMQLKKRYQDQESERQRQEKKTKTPENEQNSKNSSDNMEIDINSSKNRKIPSFRNNRRRDQEESEDGIDDIGIIIATESPIDKGLGSLGLGLGFETQTPVSPSISSNDPNSGENSMTINSNAEDFWMIYLTKKIKNIKTILSIYWYIHTHDEVR